jgi:hypothetical protein
MQQQINQQAEARASGLPAPPATGPASPSTSGPRRLNPEFTEWLMGLPHGWTDFAPVGTGSYPWRQRMRSVLCSLPISDA